jgi:prepilin-type N-terminal cleavage/methylation domain
MSTRGFTLLEVMVATLILAIAVTGLLSGLSTSMRNAARLTDADRAALLARRTMDELLMQPHLPRFVVLEGVLDPSHGIEGGWRARRLPFEAPPQVNAGVAVLDRVELEVWWMSGSERRTFTLEGYRSQILRPEDVTPAVSR